MSWGLTVETNRSLLWLPTLPSEPPYRLKGVYRPSSGESYPIGVYPATTEVLFDLDELVQEAITFCLKKEQT